MDKTTPKPIDALIETWKLSSFHSTETFWSFDLSTQQDCATQEAFTVLHYRYGGLGIRFAAEWKENENLTITTSSGYDGKKGDQKPAKWVMYSGTLDGAETSVIIMCHPKSFRFPQIARISPKQPYWGWAPGNREAFTIAPDKPYRSRYRYVIYSGSPTVEWVDKQFAAFAASDA